MGNNISRICACNDAGNPHTGEANLAANKPLSNGAEQKNNGKMDFYDCEAMNYDVHLSKKIEETHAKARSNFADLEKNKEKAYIKNSNNTMADNTTNNTDNQNRLSNNGDVFVYEGDTVNHKKHGRGILKTPNGEIVYVGHFKDDLFSGRGCLILNNHDEYEGEFLEGKRNGFGTLISADKKYRYDGQWENDLKHGKGYEVVTDLYVYDGEFKEGKKDGTGTYTFSNGSYYEGTFKDDKIDGKGKYFWNEKRMYEGDWSENNINGFGVLYDSGKIYIGNFEKDKRNGRGLYINKDNNILIGNFINNELDGFALIISNKGEDFCKFSNGKKMQLPDELIAQNHKDLEEYKELKNFYNENNEIVKKYVFI